MKTVEEWIDSLNAQDGADVNPCNIKPAEVRAIQADALRHAAEAIRLRLVSIQNRPYSIDIQTLTRQLNKQADQLEKGPQ